VASIREALEHRLAAVGATVVPAPLLEWQQVSHIRPVPPMRVGFRSVDGVRIRYAVSDGPAERTVVLTSPWPESIYAYAPIWPALAGRFRLLAVDLPGFGASDARADLSSPRTMGAFLIRLIEDWELGRPHLVAPDVGTSAALFATLQSPDSVTSVVVGSGGAAVDPDVEGFRGLDPTVVVDAALSTMAGHELPRATRADYHDCYAGDRLVESIGYVLRCSDELPALAERLGEIETPVMVFAGSRDRVAAPGSGDFLARRLRNCQLAMLGAGHFVWEEVPDAFAQLLGGWIDEHS
jgi:pimeloyl-ACP methyl ester carboxylesterase